MKKHWNFALCLMGILALTLPVHAQSTAPQAAGLAPDVTSFLASLAPPAPEPTALPPVFAASCYCRPLNPSTGCTF